MLIEWRLFFHKNEKSDQNYLLLLCWISGETSKMDSAKGKIAFLKTDFNLLISRLGGLDLSWSCLDQDSRSQHRQKQFVSMVEKILSFSKSLSRQSRNLDPDRDFSISSRHQCWDPKVLIKIVETLRLTN